LKRTQKRTTRSRNTEAYDVDNRTSKQKFFDRVHEEETYERQQSLPALEPKNNNQRLALSYLRDDKKKVVFLTGSAGTGKSLLAAYRAACLLKQKKITKVYLVRPAVSVGKSVGMLPGDVKEKLTPYFKQTMAHLRKFLGNGYMNYCLEKEIIEMQPVEYLRGQSFEECLVIAEEVQNFTAEEMEMMLTRMGDGGELVFTGDTKQHDMKGMSGLETTVNLISRIQASQPAYLNREDVDNLDEGIGIVQFKPEDVVRSGLTRTFVKIFYNNA
jgi:phosphate starvation-inducible PhoH-like protein